MYALDSPPSGLPFTTRSTLQALLKSRGAVPVPRQNKWILPKDDPTSPSLIADSSELLVHQSPQTALTDADLQNGDQNTDFSYSQKLFHIDDGNLYSIFSPLQGRSYGMKPSFLRKQKCTVQECHGRGRKGLRKGLKFHNFLPSESVTSEKDNNNIKEESWKVHSECKLREEHGTKQIMVSNWFQNVKHTREDGSSGSSHSSESIASTDSTIDSPASASTTGIYTFPTDIKSESTSPMPYECNLNGGPSIETGKKFSVLNSLLHSVAKTQNAAPELSTAEFCKQSGVFGSGQKRRRKPDQTRRVVPYTKYLSLMEENESSPLDLSLHTSSDPAKNELRNKNGVSQKPLITNEHDGMSYNQNNFEIGDSLEKASPSNMNQNLVCPFLPTLSTFVQLPPKEKTVNEKTFDPAVGGPSLFHYSQSHPLRKPTVGHSNQFSPPKSKTRRKSQRSMIKQKLEDTFRQNGFLVKTKQVSDGDATFCKFRQLRKYTRYYLKSWQQHLPDEVHKMWKGFLPPKTVLPPVSGTSVQHTVNENPM